MFGLAYLHTHGRGKQTKIFPSNAYANRQQCDDVYKTGVVLITKHYVTEESDLPAGTAAKALFAAINEKGWHEVRWLDASGERIERKP